MERVSKATIRRLNQEDAPGPRPIWDRSQIESRTSREDGRILTKVQVETLNGDQSLHWNNEYSGYPPGKRQAKLKEHPNRDAGLSIIPNHCSDQIHSPHHHLN